MIIEVLKLVDRLFVWFVYFFGGHMMCTLHFQPKKDGSEAGTTVEVCGLTGTLLAKGTIVANQQLDLSFVKALFYYTRTNGVWDGSEGKPNKIKYAKIYCVFSETQP